MGKQNARLLGAVGVGLVALVVALAVTPDGKSAAPHDSKKKPGGSGSSSASPSAPGGPSNAPGLPRGQATASGKLGTKTIGGVPRAFPHTEAGAIESAATLFRNSFTMLRLPKDERAALQTDLYLTKKDVPPDFEERGKTWRAQHNLNESGQLVTLADGKPDENRRFTSLCHPELGAYKTETYSGDKATITVWYPCLSGVVDPTAPGPLDNNWALGQVSLQWARGDWRVTKTGTGSYNTTPSPQDPGQPATSYAERAKLLEPLGGGWKLFSDATNARPAELKEATQ
ncbi:hypothetical protein [Streptomyces kronopolitis]|uniref:hypothetical protein n=1 Tax=Streptomyces kronopolitis TaxID=1612435 RepID=UPI003D99E5DA